MNDAERRITEARYQAKLVKVYALTKACLRNLYNREPTDVTHLLQGLLAEAQLTLYHYNKLKEK